MLHQNEPLYSLSCIRPNSPNPCPDRPCQLLKHPFNHRKILGFLDHRKVVAVLAFEDHKPKPVPRRSLHLRSSWKADTWRRRDGPRTWSRSPGRRTCPAPDRTAFEKNPHKRKCVDPPPPSEITAEGPNCAQVQTGVTARRSWNDCPRKRAPPRTRHFQEKYTTSSLCRTSGSEPAARDTA